MKDTSHLLLAVCAVAASLFTGTVGQSKALPHGIEVRTHRRNR
jgi:hypothetical protein